MEINETTVDHIAELARLELSPEERKLYAGQLKDILGWVEELNKADTAAVPPAAGLEWRGAPQFNYQNAAAEDIPETFTAREDILKLAPAREFDFIKVRKVIE